MGIAFNSQSLKHKKPLGCAKLGENVSFRVYLEKRENPSNVQLILRDFKTGESEKINMEFVGQYGEEMVFEASFTGNKRQILRYHFEYDSNDKRRYVYKRQFDFTSEVLEQKAVEEWQISVYTPIKTHPNMNSGIVYQIFPDCFCREEGQEWIPGRKRKVWGDDESTAIAEQEISKDFFGGNLRGVISKLDYIKSLGVKSIYFNPIWWASTNHRYDTNDYRIVDPLLGKIEDLKELIQEIHNRGMILILDVVLNHMGWKSPYFEDACKSKESPYYDWFHFIEYPSRYECWWNDRSLPKNNQNSKSFREFVYGKSGVLDYWFSLGVDGFRLDVVDEYNDDIVKLIYEAAKRNKEFIIIIGEVWEDASCKESYGDVREYLLGEELTSVMNYPVKDAILAYVRYGEEERWVKNLWYTLKLIYLENYPREVAYSLMNLLSTHDTVRAITKLAGPEVDNHDRNWQKEHDKLTKKEYELGKKRLKIAYLLLYILPGTPCIFYGDEAGLYGMTDPLCRKCYPWGYEDEELIEYFQQLGSMRSKNEEFFDNADFEPILVDSEKCILERRKSTFKIRTIVNITDKPINISGSIGLGETAKVVIRINEEDNEKIISPFGGVMLEIF